MQRDDSALQPGREIHLAEVHPAARDILRSVRVAGEYRGTEMHVVGGLRLESEPGSEIPCVTTEDRVVGRPADDAARERRLAAPIHAGVIRLCVRIEQHREIEMQRRAREARIAGAYLRERRRA